MKVMRSTREGSVCSEASCRKEIKVGDPIAYFGPRAVFGLTCHWNEKTERHLRNLLKEEGVGDGAKIEEELSRLYAEKTKGSVGSTEGTATGAKTGGTPVDVAARQEWVVRMVWSSDVLNHQVLDAFRWMLSAGYGQQLAQTLNVIEFRAPRTVGVVATKRWAEQQAVELMKLCPGLTAEAAPLWV